VTDTLLLRGRPTTGDGALIPERAGQPLGCGTRTYKEREGWVGLILFLSDSDGHNVWSRIKIHFIFLLRNMNGSKLLTEIAIVGE